MPDGRTKAKPLTNAAGEARELQAADFARARPFSALPRALQAKLRKMGKRESTGR